MNEFLQKLSQLDSSDENLLDFCRKNVLHGTPSVFKESEEKYYDFRKRIANKFSVDFHEIYITGSAKLGFSPIKRKSFDLESDIDVAIISTSLYERMMDFVLEYQIQLRTFRKTVTEKEIHIYHKFLEYSALGWIRPDLLPYSFRGSEIKNDWFDFFKSISYGKSEVGNYKVSAGVFKSHKHLEKYTLEGIRSVKKTLEIQA